MAQQMTHPKYSEEPLGRVSVHGVRMMDYVRRQQGIMSLRADSVETMPCTNTYIHIHKHIHTHTHKHTHAQTMCTYMHTRYLDAAVLY